MPNHLTLMLKSMYAEAPYSDTANGWSPIFAVSESFSILSEVGKKLLVSAGLGKERVKSFARFNGFARLAFVCPFSYGVESQLNHRWLLRCRLLPRFPDAF